MQIGMKRAISVLFALILIAVSVIPAQAAEINELIKYPEYPEPYLPRDYAYSVSVTQGENSIDIPVYNAARQYDNFRSIPEGDYYRRFCEFAFSGDPVTVKVRVNIDMTCCEVLPSSKNFPSTIKGNEISITLTKPENVVVRLNDDLYTMLTIFAEAPEDEADIPTKGDENVIYCDAGLDNITGGEIVNDEITLTEGQTLYLAPGALVQARLIITGSNTTVKGRGALIDPETTRVKYHEEGSYMLKAKSTSYKTPVTNMNISGIKLLDSRSFNIVLVNVTDSTISDVKVFSNQVSTDGISLFDYVHNLTVQDSYLYVNDNVFVFGGWSLENNVFKNLTIGSGYALFFPQGGSKSTTFENLDIFHVRSFYKATMTLSKSTTTQNIYCKNIYAADVPEIGSFINCKNQNSGEKNVYFENVSLPANKRTITFATSETYPTSNLNFNINNLWFGNEQFTSLSTDYSQYANFNFSETSDAAAAMAGSNTRVEASYIANKIYVGGCLLRNFKALPQTIGDTVYVDAVGVLENLGYTVDFEGGALTFRNKYSAYSVICGELTGTKNGITKTLSNPIIVKDGSVIMPVSCFDDLAITAYTYDESTKSLYLENKPTGENLLTNADFEQGTTYDWVTFEFADLYSSSDSYSGEKSLKVGPCVWSSGTINNYDYGVTQYVKDVMDKNGAGKYHLEAMVKLDTEDQRFVNDDADGDGNANDVADVETIRMGFTLGGTSISYVSAYNETLRNNRFDISSEWRKIELDVDITESFLKNCTNLYFFIGSRKNEKKSFFIDDVKLIKIQDTPSEYTVNRLEASERLISRAYKEDDSVVMAMSGAGVEYKINCEGDVKATLVNTQYYDKTSYLGVMIDGDYDSHQLIAINGEYNGTTAVNITNEVTIAAGLEAGEHTIRIWRPDNYRCSTYRLKSLSFIGEESAAPAAAKYTIDFYGDSITAGQGNVPLSDGGTTYTEYTANAFDTYAGVAGRELNADINICALPGCGLAYGSSDTKENISDGHALNIISNIYDYASPKDKYKWDYSAYTPDLAVVSLGQNDISHAENVSDRDYNDELKEKIKDLIEKIRQNDKTIPIVWIGGLMSEYAAFARTDDFINIRTSVSEVIEENGYKDIYFKLIPGNTDGGFGHPSAKTHKSIGEALASYIKTLDVLNHNTTIHTPLIDDFDGLDSVDSKKYVKTGADGPVLSDSPVVGDGRNQVIKIENCESKGSVYARLRIKLTNANVAVPENCIGFKFDLYTADSVTMGVLGKNSSATTKYGTTYSLSRIKAGQWVTIYDIIDTSKCQPSDIGIVDIILNYGSETSPTTSAAVYVDNISFLTVCDKTGETEVRNAKAATCTTDGYTGDIHCKECGDKLGSGTAIPATGHTEQTIKGKAATCTEDGLTDGKKCSVCGEIIVAQQTIKASGHTEETIKGKAATCTEDGLTDGQKCSVCGEIIIAQQTIKANGHNFGEWIVTIPATANNTGVRERVCSDCGEKMTEIIPKIEVVFGDLNDDGKVNLLDLIAMRKYLAKWNVKINIDAADCNGDGKVNLLDLILLRKYLAKWNVVFGPQKV